MPKNPKRNNHTWVTLAKDFVKEWPEVLEGLNYSNLPIQYVSYININLRNGLIIHYDITKELKKDSARKVVMVLKKTLETNYKNIRKLDLKFDIPRLKKDVTSKTKTFLSKKLID
ncbi:MAG: hypothetical protein CMM91_06110 [Rickettsiales bacterium]|jgi:hypothetical protein|nr:hypothetical protein [Rickettsiales bacterium]|tara:strand:+ start:20652 stop:20996 length:345 start_codon:yes stop_codon:yes gene_type:complete